MYIKLPGLDNDYQISCFTIEENRNITLNLFSPSSTLPHQITLSAAEIGSIAMMYLLMLSGK